MNHVGIPSDLKLIVNQREVDVSDENVNIRTESINITGYLFKFSHMVDNLIIQVNDSDIEKKFYFGIYAFKKMCTEQSLDDLINQISTQNDNSEQTRKIIRDKFKNGASASKLKVSLICPMTQIRIIVPGRGIHCQHVECFDLETFLVINERMCPICDCSIDLNCLVIDDLFKEILANEFILNEVEFDSNADYSEFDQEFFGLNLNIENDSFNSDDVYTRPILFYRNRIYKNQGKRNQNF